MNILFFTENPGTFSHPLTGVLIKPQACVLNDDSTGWYLAENKKKLMDAKQISYEIKSLTDLKVNNQLP